MSISNRLTAFIAGRIAGSRVFQDAEVVVRTVLLIGVLLPFSSVASAGAQEPLPDSIPVFPLPDIALLPGAGMPLHIFEPRYREMVAAALEADSVIGMVMLRPGWERDYEGDPPVYEVGGAGTIERVQVLPDGRYNLLLRGTSRFRIEGEDTSRSYRVARVEPIPESLTDGERVQLGRARSQLEEWIREQGPEVEVPPDLSDEAFVHTLIQYLPMEPAQRQELVEAQNALFRAEGLMELLGMVRQARRQDGASGS